MLSHVIGEEEAHLLKFDKLPQGALGPKMYKGLPALGLKMYKGQPAYDGDIHGTLSF